MSESPGAAYQRGFDDGRNGRESYIADLERQLNELRTFIEKVAYAELLNPDITLEGVRKIAREFLEQ